LVSWCEALPKKISHQATKALWRGGNSIRENENRMTGWKKDGKDED